MSEESSNEDVTKFASEDVIYKRALVDLLIRLCLAVEDGDLILRQHLESFESLKEISLKNDNGDLACAISSYMDEFNSALQDIEGEFKNQN